MKHWLPQPLLSLCLWLVWLLLANSVAPGHLLLGAALAIALPLFTVRFWPNRPRIQRPWKLLRYVLMLSWDIVVANVAVARLILGPVHRLRPAFVRLPLDLDNEFALVMLIHSLSLTPGTVSADVSADRRFLLVHVLDVEDQAQLIARIKQRYEAPLKEIFVC